MNRVAGAWEVVMPKLTFAQSINKALHEAIEDESVVVGGQMVKYGVAGLTTGLFEKRPQQIICYSVSEALMTSSAMGLALAGKKVVQLHVRMDFLLCGMDALFNHIPVWVKKGSRLPITFICQVGKGMGQGAQHNKNLTSWFERCEGWTVRVPQSPRQGYEMLKESIAGDSPVMFVLHRELFDLAQGKKIVTPQRIVLKGAADDR